MAELRPVVLALKERMGWNNRELADLVGSNTSSIVTWINDMASEENLRTLTPKLKELTEKEFDSEKEEESESEEEAVKKWAQCDRCDKWRTIPEHAVGKLPKFWTCDLNTWDPARDSCDKPEADFGSDEDESDEEESRSDYEGKQELIREAKQLRPVVLALKERMGWNHRELADQVETNTSSVVNWINDKVSDENLRSLTPKLKALTEMSRRADKQTGR